MENRIFREKSLERISSPEQLHDYMKVTGPRMWMILTAVLVLIVGFVIAASMFTMENSLEVQVQVYRIDEETATASFSLPLSEKGSIDVGMTVRFGNYEGNIDIMYQDASDVNAIVMLKKGSALPEEGTYDGKVIIERITPISFLLN